MLKKLSGWFQRQKRVLPWREALGSDSLTVPANLESKRRSKTPSSGQGSGANGAKLNPPIGAHRHPYRVWLSEMMLQQTQVVTVIPYFHRFLELFPTIEDLASAKEEDVMKAWAGLGYYSRARNLQKGAKHIVSQGKFPQSLEEWLEVPGVGPYTAGAVCSLSLGQYVPLVDGNVERVFSRLFCLSRKTLGEKQYRDEQWRLAKLAISKAEKLGLSAGDVNEGWMELGATVCTTKNPVCGLCPLQKNCTAFREERVTAFPEKKPKPEKIFLEEKVIALLDKKRRKVLLEDSTHRQWRKGLWDFPEALPVEFSTTANGRARKASNVALTESILKSKHVVTNHQISRETRVIFTEKRMIDSKGFAWVSLDHPERPLGAPSRKIIKLILERFF
jgi:A/G-specific adenine glycosylase